MSKAAIPPAAESTQTTPLDPATGSDAETTGKSSAANGTRSAHPSKRKHKARIEHKTPGRIRMKIPSAKSNPEVLDVFVNAFSAVPGITKVNPKRETGSIVIHYDPKREAEFESHFHHCWHQHDMGAGGGAGAGAARPGDEIEEIAKKIEAEAEFLAERSELVRATVDLFKGLDYQIKAVSGNTIDLKIVLVGGLAVATFVEIGAEAATPMWVTLALFAVNHFIEMKHDPSNGGRTAMTPAGAGAGVAVASAGR